MILLAVVTLICATVLLIGYRAERVLSAKWNGEQAIARLASGHAVDAARIAEQLDSRRVSVSEREIALKEQQHRRPDASEPMPSDLEDRIHSWEDDWAQDQERSNIMTLYSVFADWDTVRSKLAPLAPVVSTDIAAPRDGMVQ